MEKYVSLSALVCSLTYKQHKKRVRHISFYRWHQLPFCHCLAQWWAFKVFTAELAGSTVTALHTSSQT